MIPRTRSLIVAAGALILALVSASARAAAEAPPPTIELRDCGTRGEGRSPQKQPGPEAVRIGPLVIWPSIRRRAGPAGDPAWPFVVKAPIVLPARTKVVLAIAFEATSRAAFQSHRRGWVSAVRFEACREQEPAFAYRGTVGKLTGFPFAIGLKQPASCIPMQVWMAGRTAPIRRIVPVGRRSC